MEKKSWTPVEDLSCSCGPKKKPVKVYVAGKWNDRLTIHQRMLELQMLGFQITHFWTTAVPLIITAENAHEDKNDSAFLGKCAAEDIDGVGNANILVAIMNDTDYPYRGTFTEIGAALVRGIPIFIVRGVNTKCEDYAWYTNTFAHHAHITHVEGWEELLKQLNKGG